MKKYIIYGVVALLVFMILRGLFSKPSQATTQTQPTKTPFKCGENVDRNKVIKLGTKNSNEVCYLQNWLNLWFGESLKIDGNFGLKTQAALVKAKNMAYGSLNSIGA